MKLIPAAVRRLFSAKRADAPKKSVGYYTSEYVVSQAFDFLEGIADPDVVLQSLGIPRHKLEKLYADDEIAAAMDTRRDAAVSTPWRLEPGTGGPVEFVWEELARVMQSLLIGSFSALPYGYSVQEVIYERRDGGLIGVRALHEKPMEWFEPQRDGGLIWLRPDGRREPLDTKFKFLLTRRLPTWKNPFGEALFSRLYWAWYCRHNTWKFWVQFLERFGDPLLIGKSHDAGRMVEELSKLGVTNLVAVGSEDALEQVTPSGSGEFEKVELALARRIQKMVLGQTLTSEVTGGGSYAAAKVQNEVRQDKRDADLLMLRTTAQTLVNALWSLNGFPGQPPEFVFEDGAGIELERAERDAKLVQAGIVRLTKPYLLRVYDFEEEDIEVAAEGVTLSSGGAQARTYCEHHGVHLALPARYSDGQEAIERGVSQAMQAAPPQPVPVDRIRQAVRAATDPDDLVRRLALLFDAQDPQFADVLERAMFAAEVLGYIVADDYAGNPSRKRGEQ